MTTELIVAEKPKVAQKIAEAIGQKVNVRKHGRVSYYEVERDDDTVYVAPAVGHVYTLAEKKKTSAYPAFDIEWVASYKVSKESDYTKAYVDVLDMLAKKADVFTSACDYDIEGSLIGANVYRFGPANGKEARRMKFSALTASDLREAFEHRSELDYNNAYAGEARHILDWYYGINLSRALMSALRSNNRYRVMSIGRVQGPALEMLTSLEREIAVFVPTPYWEITAQINGVEFGHAKGRFLQEEEAKTALERTGKNGTVKNLEKKEQIIGTLPPFDLTSLQVEAYRTFKFTPARTLDIAQTLYEDSLISYPRTSSQKLPPGLPLPGIIKKLGEQPAYADLARQLLDHQWIRPAEGKKEDPAHPAIHPTGQREQMNEQQAKLYDLIVRRFLACFAPPTRKERTKVDVDSQGEMYGATGSRTVEKGWTEFYGPYYTAEDKELPAFSVGQSVTLEKKKNTKKETKPPGRYSEASIVSELEKKKLGTKATRAEIIETLYKRNYAEGKSIRVTDLGLKVCAVLEKYVPEIMDENLTRQIEEEMEKVQEGTMDKQALIDEGREILVRILERWKKNEQKIGVELLGALKSTEDKERNVGPCKLCGGTLRIIRMKMGRQFIGCSGYPNCRNAYPLPTGGWVATSDKPCPTCGLPSIMVRFRGGKRPFLMCIDPKCPSKDSWKKKDNTTTPSAAATTMATPATAAASGSPAPAASSGSTTAVPALQATPVPAPAAAVVGVASGSGTIPASSVASSIAPGIAPRVASTPSIPAGTPPAPASLTIGKGTPATTAPKKPRTRSTKKKV